MFFLCRRLLVQFTQQQNSKVEKDWSNVGVSLKAKCQPSGSRLQEVRGRPVHLARDQRCWSTVGLAFSAAVTPTQPLAESQPGSVYLQIKSAAAALGTASVRRSTIRNMKCTLDSGFLVLYVQELNFSQTLPVAPHFLWLCGEFFRKTFFSSWHPELFVSLSGSSTFIHRSTLSLLDALYLLWREKIISWSFIIIISLTYSDFKAESEKWYFCQRGLSSFVDNSKTNVCFTFFLNHKGCELTQQELVSCRRSVGHPFENLISRLHKNRVLFQTPDNIVICPYVKWTGGLLSQYPPIDRDNCAKTGKNKMIERHSNPPFIQTGLMTACRAADCCLSARKWR